MTDRSPLLHRIGKPMRALMRQHYNATSCIAATRIAIDVLEGLGIAARPLMVRAELFNAPMWQQIELHGRAPNDHVERDQWTRDFGAYALGLGFADPERTDLDETTNGIHVVTLVEDSLLWDLSFDQANRPDKGIPIDAPLVLAVPRAFIEGRDRAVAGFQGSVLIITARPNDRRYELSPNWRADGHDAPVRRELTATMLDGIRLFLSNTLEPRV